MIYNGIEMRILIDSLSVSKSKSQEIRHYPGTDKSEVIELGKDATRITCSIKAMNVSDRVKIEEVLHGTSKANLEFGDFFYKEVITGGIGDFKPITPDKSVWIIDAEFIALNPIPYDLSTGNKLY